MKFLYIGAGDVLARHELGFITALSSLGNVKVISLGTEVGVEKLKVGSDNGVWNVLLYRVPCNNFLGITRCRDRIRKFVDLKEADIIFATPRIPVIVVKLLSKDLPVILRLWSISATKLKDNLRFGAREDVFFFIYI